MALRLQPHPCYIVFQCVYYPRHGEGANVHALKCIPPTLTSLPGPDFHAGPDRAAAVPVTTPHGSLLLAGQGSPTPRSCQC